MCGIIAIKTTNKEALNSIDIKAGLEALALRGPDASKHMQIDNVLLGHTRLSIIDLSSGGQPMTTSDGAYTIVFNGEIYNYKILREKLQKSGAIFKTHSDTEVILQAYIAYDKDCVKELDGMFAFVIYDKTKNRLFVARDRFGKKPLYYTKDKDDNFYFASEIKALHALGFKGVINKEALDAYLSLMYVPPHMTIYSNIKTIPPAHFAIVDENGIRREKYWHLIKAQNTDTYDEAKQKIKTLFKDAVTTRMLSSDVEVGSLLSGGVDSSLVSIYASRILSKPLKTFSLSYGDTINELPYALKVSEKIRSDHHTLSVNDSLLSELRKTFEYLDEPHGDSSDVSQYLISNLAHKSVKVALTGDGADEFFLGYGWYWKHLQLPFFKRITARLFSDPFKDHLKLIEIFSQKERSELLAYNAKPIFVPEEVRDSGLNSEDKMNLWDILVYLPGQLLTKIDRTSMANSLEVRSPFLDTKLAEYVYSLPASYKLDGKNNNGKIILKDILTEEMDPDFVYRRKQGFGAPVKTWLHLSEIKTFLVALSKNKEHQIFSYISQKETQHLTHCYYNGEEKLAYRVWLILCLAIWFETHKADIE
ncbi:MAG: asparagine synthase [Candidatus Taylorbacteria bacterium]|nr:asparagine synthase [Candidatus Taylorbacteria bacterium]